jgi:hypothetical protein
MRRDQHFCLTIPSLKNRLTLPFEKPLYPAFEKLPHPAF